MMKYVRSIKLAILEISSIYINTSKHDLYLQKHHFVIFSAEFSNLKDQLVIFAICHIAHLVAKFMRKKVQKTRTDLVEHTERKTLTAECRTDFGKPSSTCELGNIWQNFIHQKIPKG